MVVNLFGDHDTSQKKKFDNFFVLNCVLFFYLTHFQMSLNLRSIFVLSSLRIC